MFSQEMVTLTFNNVERYIMRKKKNEEKEFEKELEKVQFDEEPTVELLKQIVSQNEQIIQLLTKLKERFI